MKYILISTAILFNILNADTSSVKIPYKECSKYPYAHTIGGTMHSRFIEKKRLYKIAKQKAAFTEEEALKNIQSKYPSWSIENAEIAIKSCFVYFKSVTTKYIYYFDAKTLELIQKKER